MLGDTLMEQIASRTPRFQGRRGDHPRRGLLQQTISRLACKALAQASLPQQC
jgi:hypothetical protein